MMTCCLTKLRYYRNLQVNCTHWSKCLVSLLICFTSRCLSYSCFYFVSEMSNDFKLISIFLWGTWNKCKYPISCTWCLTSVLWCPEEMASMKNQSVQQTNLVFLLRKYENRKIPNSNTFNTNIKILLKNRWMKGGDGFNALNAKYLWLFMFCVF